MNRFEIRLCLAAAALLASGLIRAVDGVAETFLSHLEAQRYAEAHALFAEQTASALDADQLRRIWESLPAQLGEYRGRGGFEDQVIDGRALRIALLEFSAMALSARISVDESGRIDGFRLLPVARPRQVSDPEASEQWIEADATVAGDLPALLTLPRGEGPFPAVVFVHGSGPNDRDQTLGPNKPLRDLARGLAEKGIASIRYDKRSHAQPQAFEGQAFTLDDQVIDDVHAALLALGKHQRIDPARRFVIGHSLGAMLGPRIAAGRSDIAGLILLAAPARPLNEIIVDQVEYIAAIDGEIDEAERQQIELLRRQADAAGAMTDRESAAPALLGQPESFWADLAGYDPVAAAAQLEIPVFIAQGGRDYQVTVDDDLARWRGAFDGDPRVRVREYPDLNHLFMTGEGMATPQEYLNVAGRVDPALIEDLAEWVLQ